MLPGARREGARRAVAAERPARPLDREQVDVGIADPERLADEHSLACALEIARGRSRRLGRPDHEERPEPAHVERSTRIVAAGGRSRAPAPRCSARSRRGSRRRGRAAARGRAGSRAQDSRRPAAAPSAGSRRFAPRRRGRAARSRRGRRRGGSSPRGRPKPRPARPAAHRAPTRRAAASSATPRRAARRRAPGARTARIDAGGRCRQRPPAPRTGARR